MSNPQPGNGSPIRLILNGKASTRDDIREAVLALRESGYDLEVRVTWEHGDAARLAREALAEGVGTLIAGGGDGTLNELVSGLYQAAEGAPPDCSLGLLPLGSANDFAKGCGIPDGRIEDLLRALLISEAKPIDIGKVGEKVFINVASGGLGTKITAETNSGLKRVFGGTAYLLTGLARLGEIEPVTGCLRGPDFEWEGSFWGVAVGNGRFAGGGMEACPDALLADGLLDITLLPDEPDEPKAEKVTSFLLQGKSAIDRDVLRWRAPELEIEVPGGLHFNLDGEPSFEQDLRFTVCPSWVKFHLPALAPV